MNRLAPVGEVTPAAFDNGLTCAVAAQGQRDLQRCVTTYPGLFPAPPFDGTVFATLSMANAFSAPGLAAEQLRVLNRASLWAFRADWLFDHVAVARTEVAELAQRCVAVAAGAAPAPEDQFERFLADLRGQLAAAPTFAELGVHWVAELALMFDAMLREWDWKATGHTPGVEEYLDNADNLGSSFVDLSHWLSDPGPDAVHSGPEDLVLVLAATRASQRVIRVLNDLASLERDQRSGDLNLLGLGPDRGEVAGVLAALTADAGAAWTSLRRTQPDLAGFLRRQVEFCQGFYGRTDYWGDV